MKAWHLILKKAKSTHILYIYERYKKIFIYISQKSKINVKMQDTYGV